MKFLKNEVVVQQKSQAHVNKFQCCWCTQFDDEANLRTADQRWANTKPNSENAKTMTYKWKKWLQLSNMNISCTR